MLLQRECRLRLTGPREITFGLSLSSDSLSVIQMLVRWPSLGSLAVMAACPVSERGAQKSLRVLQGLPTRVKSLCCKGVVTVAGRRRMDRETGG